MTQFPSAPSNANGTRHDLFAPPKAEISAQENQSRGHTRNRQVNSSTSEPVSSRRYRLPDRGPGYLYEIMANHLTIRIADGDLTPNMALPSEQLLAWEYGVSLGTVRHASRLLCYRGLLVTVKSKGSYISTITPLAAKELLERSKNEIAMEQAHLTEVIK